MEPERESNEQKNGKPEGSLSLLRRYLDKPSFDYMLWRIYNAWKVDAKPRSEGGRGYYVRNSGRDDRYVVIDPKPLCQIGHSDLWRPRGSGRDYICATCHPPVPSLDVEWL
jgi:hypothetical protein